MKGYAPFAVLFRFYIMEPGPLTGLFLRKNPISGMNAGNGTLSKNIV